MPSHVLWIPCHATGGSTQQLSASAMHAGHVTCHATGGSTQQLSALAAAEEDEEEQTNKSSTTGQQAEQSVGRGNNEGTDEENKLRGDKTEDEVKEVVLATHSAGIDL